MSQEWRVYLEATVVVLDGAPRPDREQLTTLMDNMESLLCLEKGEEETLLVRVWCQLVVLSSENHHF